MFLNLIYVKFDNIFVNIKNNYNKIKFINFVVKEVLKWNM